MKIIGHRGAVSLAPENTLAGFKAAQKAGVDAIEFDIQATADQQLVVCHDENLLRTYGVDKKISVASMQYLANIQDEHGYSIPKLSDALLNTGNTSLIIEGKGQGWALPLANLLTGRKDKLRLRVISFNRDELLAFARQCPDIQCYLLAHHNASEALQVARINKLAGIDVNHWLLNPILYWSCRRHKLGLIVYTVNNKLIARFIGWLYPDVELTTDVPHKLQFLRSPELRKKPTSVKI